MREGQGNGRGEGERELVDVHEGAGDGEYVEEKASRREKGK